ncbi:MAG: phosphonate C-P lyase system protein PhnG, partial [Clostridium sp.]
MNRKRRTEILIRGNKSLSNRLSEEVEKNHNVKLIDEPNYGLVMIKTRESAKNTLFYLGETLVTEAKVYVNGEIGLGIVQGDEPELAYNLAVIDGAYNANIKEIESFNECLITEEIEIKKIDEIEN